MTDTFLPQDYKEPITGKYLRFEQGSTVFRILATPIMGYEYWVTDGDKRKPVRKRPQENIPQGELEANPKTGEPETPKFFWALPIYVESDNSIKILEITQKGIRNAITSLSQSKVWGSPLNYDIEVTRACEGLETAYTVLPQPKSELSASAKEMIDEVLPTIHMDALFSGADPFAGKPTEEITVKDIEDAGL